MLPSLISCQVTIINTKGFRLERSALVPSHSSIKFLISVTNRIVLIFIDEILRVTETNKNEEEEKEEQEDI